LTYNSDTTYYDMSLVKAMLSVTDKNFKFDDDYSLASQFITNTEQAIDQMEMNKAKAYMEKEYHESLEIKQYKEAFNKVQDQIVQLNKTLYEGNIQ